MAFKRSTVRSRSAPPVQQNKAAGTRRLFVLCRVDARPDKSDKVFSIMNGPLDHNLTDPKSNNDTVKYWNQTQPDA